MAQHSERYIKIIRDNVWKSEDPDFQNCTIPEKYNNESAVIIAMREEVYANGKTKAGFSSRGLYNYNRNKELYFTQFVRSMVKINDKSALDEFGDFEYLESAKRKERYVSSKIQTIIGVRIIKPDGTIKEVDVDEAISVSEKDDQNENYKKLAISDLEIGDIIDFFSQVEEIIEYANIPQLDFFFTAEYPILSYSAHCEIDNQLTVEHRSINGAPDFILSTNENNNIVLDVKKNDLPRFGDSFWRSTYREVPVIRLSILFNSSRDIFKPASARKSGVYKDIPTQIIIQDAMWLLTVSYQYNYNEIKKKTKEYVNNNRGVSKEDIALYIDESLREYVSRVEDIYSHCYVATLFNLFKDFKIENKIAFVTSRFAPRSEEVTTLDDFRLMIIANDGKQIFAPPINSRYMCGSTLPQCEGETAFLLSTKKLSVKKDGSLVGELRQITMPSSTAEQNTQAMNLDITITDDNVLDIDRTITLSGHCRNDLLRPLVNWSEWRDAKRKWLKRESIYEYLISRNNKESLREYRANVEKTASNIEKIAKQEIESYHDIPAKEMKSHKMVSLGATPTDSLMIYKVAYSIEGLVKRAGNNLIIDAGKLIGEQMELKDSERERNENIYRLYPCCISYKINIQIPDGYTVENIDKMNISLDNQSASFISSASINESILSLTVSKVYKNNFEPVNNWNKLVEVIDMANKYYSQSIILRKNEL